MWRRWGFIRQVKLQLVKFIRLRGLPEEIAKGVALGIFIGMTPTFGFQMLIAIFFALLLKENRLAAILGVWITNPLTAPFIYAVEYELGRVMLGMDRLSLPDEFTLSSLSELGWNILLPMWAGGIFAGIIVGALSYAITLRLVPVVKNLRVQRWPRPRRHHRRRKLK